LTKMYSELFKLSRKLNRLFFYKVLFLLLLNTSVSPQSNGDIYRKYVELFPIAKNVPSLSAGISKENKIVFIGSAGYINLENNVPATTKSVYRLASISKSITAVAILQLFEAGKLNLDEDVSKYVKYFPKKKWPVSIRRILNHTSGIRTYRNDEEFNNTKNFPDIKSSVFYFANDSLEHQPGTRYLYSTLSYNLLAAVIEEVSGKSYNNYIREKIFNPAGMSSAYLDFHQNIIPNRASGYQKNKLRLMENASLADLTIKFPGGGIATSIEDLIKFGNALLNNTLIQAATLDSALQPTKLLSGKIIQYGLGFDTRKDEFGNLYFGHSGGGTGFTSNLIIYPDDKIVAAYLLNIRDRNLENPAQLFAWHLMGEKTLEMPKKPLSDWMLTLIDKDSIESILNTFDSFREDSSNVFLTGVTELKNFGYDLLAYKKYTEAIAVFSKLIDSDPALVDGYIGLGDTYLNDDNRGLALRNYRRVLRIDPNNEYAKRMIKSIENKN